MNTILKISGLTKKYHSLTALHHLNLEIEQGMVFGLIGPNGSGKTTTLGLILDVLTPSSGSFEWFGKPPSAKSRKNIGAILETPCFYPYMTAVQNLCVVAKIKECSTDRIAVVLKEVDLFDRKDDNFNTYSLGMKQRLAIASALLADPAVLILDEPTNGLDPQGIVEIRHLITNIATKGKTIILASHLLDEVQKVCTDFCVLKQGVIRYVGSVNLALSNQTTIEVGATDLTALANVLSNIAAITKIKRTDTHFNVSVSPELTPESLNILLYQKGIFITHLLKRGESLEQQFLKILKDND